MNSLLVIGDVFEALEELPAGSVDLILTSPPFLALRSYLPEGHPDKDKEIGSELTPAEFIDTLLDVAEACERVLAPHGSLVFELGDTYSGSGGAGGDYTDTGMRAGQAKFEGSALQHRRTANRNRFAKRYELDEQPRTGPGRTRSAREDWPLDKSMCGIPHLFHLSLAYGRNMLRPERLTDPWRVRNVVAWTRPNPPVGALGDKYRPATSYLTVACKARDRYFDLEAVRSAPSANAHPRTAKGVAVRASTGKATHNDRRGGNFATLATEHASDGAPPLDYWEPLPEEQELWDAWLEEVWQIPTAPYKGSHYATWPPMLCVRPILSMCPEQVCLTCGEPRRRILEPTAEHAEHLGRDIYGKRGQEQRAIEGRTHSGAQPRVTADYNTVGWTDCGHDNWRRGIVLDPFAGSGTTLSVANGHGRDAIGIDLDERNIDLVRERVGMFLTVLNTERKTEAQ